MVFRMCGMLVLSVGLVACVALPVENESRIDEKIMYGGIDRAKYPDLSSADEKFISDVTLAFGSRKVASQRFVDQGYKFYNNDQLGMATRRFNQAWLLDRDNPEVYSGFAAVLLDQKKYCESKDQIEKATRLNPPYYQGVYTDAGRIFALCAIKETTDTTKRALILKESEALYQKAESIEADKKYTYTSWARTYLYRADYGKAWDMVFKLKSIGGKPSEELLAMLRRMQPEPKSQ